MTVRSHCARLVVLLALCLAPSPVRAGAIEYFNVANTNWSGGSYSDDRSGKFSHCVVNATYTDSTTMLFSVTRDFQWSIAFSNPSWQLESGAKYDLTYWIDGKLGNSGKAIAIHPQIVEIPLPPDRWLFERFRKGYTLVISAVGQTFSFGLAGTARALSHALHCTQRAVLREAPVNAANPFAPAASNSNIRESTRAEATALMANILSSSGIAGFYILEASQLPAELASYDVVWTAPGVIGVLTVIGAKEASDQHELSATVLTADARDCEGKFASGIVSEGEQDAKLVNFFTACDAADARTVTYYSASPRRSGGYYLFATMNFEGDNEQARKTDENIRHAVLQLN